MIPRKTKAGDLITLPGRLRPRTGEIRFIPVGRHSVFVLWNTTGRTTQVWPGPDARYEHRDISELDVPPGPRVRRRASEQESSTSGTADDPTQPDQEIPG